MSDSIRLNFRSINMNVRKLAAGFACFIMLSLQPAFATIITSETTNVSGNTWESVYTITNDTADEIYWFAIFFDAGEYANIVYVPSIEFADWDVFGVDPFFTDAGFVDAFANVAGISVGGFISNFIVRYDYFGSSAPSVQKFVVYDPDLLDPVVIESVEFQTNVVSTPSTLLLFGLSVLAFCGFRKARV
jgi:hypothetical protein